MLELVIRGEELWDESTQTFSYTNNQTLVLEHSLISLSKWESKWHRPFLIEHPDPPFTEEQMRDYIRCMTVNTVSDPNVYNALTADDVKKVQDYISNPMTATTIQDHRKNQGKKEIITNELIYFWLTAYNIPFEPVEKWHLNRLLMLIRVCDIKNAPNNKMSRKDAMSAHMALNAARRAKYGKK